jgi:hypothetical protein
MAAACHPLAQAKVHEELDIVIGSDRSNAKPKGTKNLIFQLIFRCSADIQ